VPACRTAQYPPSRSRLTAPGDRLGLFKQLARAGPATSGELASRAGLSERYVREWLDGMYAAGYLEFDPPQERFWLPAEHVPTLADVGCGTGQALIALARAFPAVTGTGYDAHPPVIEQARQAAAEAGVADRVTYQVCDAATGLPEAFDVITTFDVVHDSADPLGLLRSIRDALQPGGRYLCLEINCADQPDGNVGPIASLLYGFSLLYCMTTSLAQDGEGLGTLGLPESRLRQLAGKAGFGQVRRVEMDNPFNTLYELTR